MSFVYLKSFPAFSQLLTYCREAEDFALSRPNISATSARKAMEFLVKFLYAAKVGEPEPGRTLFEMVTDPRFTAFVGDPTLLNSIHYIRRMGNVAVHDGTLTADDALKVLEELHFLVGETCILLGLIPDYDDFVKPGAAATTPPPAPSPQNVEVAPELAAAYAPRMRQARFDVRHPRDEEENKKLFLTASLRESGWALVNQPDQALPGCAGIQMMLEGGDTMDYVLYGRDNKPLAVVEYTATRKNPVEGRAKGIAKANQLAQKYGYRPAVYYTDGYHIFCIDPLGYPPRRVFCFHSIAELELLRLRASLRGDLNAVKVDDAITNRDYQKAAIAGVRAAFTSLRRRSLLVMATGSGKTRVAISCVDVLLKANWVKNVLFLADRTSLVRQAHKNFSKLLPGVTTSVYTGGETGRDANARVIFSTYQTMVNLVNDDTREFGIGRFDLIIIDEAHRSIFRKYRALFHYFDALMLGLTATPRSEENKSTYEAFALPEGKPDYAYELEQAIRDKYLVGFSVLDRTTELLRRGIRYDQLSPEEKERFEETFTPDDLDAQPDFDGTVVEPGRIGRRVINLGTIDVMLNDLMKNGLKINAGDKLGKTIIFAASHIEAEMIAERFRKLYPYLGMDFCKLVDSRVENSQNLIDAFGERDSLPQICASVDMLDTGIDVPDVLNLVFFKGVRSKIKFLQMVGRGTRLCKDVFGPGLDKQGFLIFDYYDNFRFFSTGDTWTTAGGSKGSALPSSQSLTLNRRRLSILRRLQEQPKLYAFDTGYRDDLRAHFLSEVRGLNNDDIEVQYNMAWVSKYRTAENWDALSESRAVEIIRHVLPLIPPEGDPAKVKSFDMLILVIEDVYKRLEDEGKDVRKIRNGFQNVCEAISGRMRELLKLKTIPAIVQKEKLIVSMLNGDYLLDAFSLEKAEAVRKELRGLMAYIPDREEYYILDVDDLLIDGDTVPGLERPKPYAEKAAGYLRDSGNPALAKLRNLDELTDAEKAELTDVFTVKLGTRAEFLAWSGNMPLLPFLRVQVGIADEAVQTKFGTLLDDPTLDQAHRIYLRQIIGYARENGDVTFLTLQQVSPFSDVDVVQLFGPKISLIKQLVNGLHKPVMQ